MKKALILSPHMDDELLIAGSLIKNFSEAPNWTLKIAFYTNGDYFMDEGPVRIAECIEAMAVLGVKQENLIFLGYGDQWKCGHIYNSDPGKICISHAGKTNTYCIDEYEEFCYKKHGIHHSYCRKNVLVDIGEMLDDELPEVIIVVNYDVHPDHRALYLFFLEAMRDLLVKYPHYKPLILTKLAYEGIYSGINDYHKLPHNMTKPVFKGIVSNPFLEWNERISIKTESSCNTLRLCNNLLYQAAKKYRSQEIKYIIPRAINSDIVFWRIYSENIAIYAEVFTSSGEKSFINDFKAINSLDINEKTSNMDASTWIPLREDKRKAVLLQWKSVQRIRLIEILENPNESESIYDFAIELDNKKFNDYTIKRNKKTIRIYLDSKAKSICFQILKGTHNAGICEINVFDHIRHLNDFNLPCVINTVDLIMPFNKITNIERMVSILDKMINAIQELFLNKLFPNEYELKRKFPGYRKELKLIYKMKYAFKRFKKKILKTIHGR